MSSLDRSIYQDNDLRTKLLEPEEKGTFFQDYGFYIDIKPGNLRNEQLEKNDLELITSKLNGNTQVNEEHH